MTFIVARSFACVLVLFFFNQFFRQVITNISWKFERSNKESLSPVKTK